MKAIVDAQVLLKELKKVSPVIKSNTVLPILTTVKLEFSDNQIIVNATDLETSISATAPCESGKKSFAIVVEFQDIVRVCEKLKGLVTISIEKDEITVVSDNGRLKFSQLHNAEHFPSIKTEEFTNEIEVDGDFFLALQHASACRNTDDMRVNMNAPCISIRKKTMEVVGTDAAMMYRHIEKKTSKTELKVMVSPTFVNAVKSFTDNSDLSISDRFIRAACGNVVVSGKLYESKFVDYEPLFANDQLFNFKCSRELLIEALDAITIAADRATNRVKIVFDGPNSIKLESQDIDYGKDGEQRMKCDSSVEIEAIGLNASQLMKLLKLMDAETVELSFTTPQKSIFIRPEGDTETICLLQPLAL